MPAYSTHYIFAKELKDKIENQVDFKLDEAAYYIGTQGPDIFFDHRIMPWMLGKSLRKTGSKLHRAKPSEIFENMREYISKSSQIEIAKSYATGFMKIFVNFSPTLANLILRQDIPPDLFCTMCLTETATRMFIFCKTK